VYAYNRKQDAPTTERLAPVHSHNFSGDFVIQQVLGAGASGSVNQARHKITGKLVAAKSVLRASVEHASDHAALVQEMQILSRIGHHPNIIELEAIYDCAEDRSYWIVMELATGGEVFHDQGILDEEINEASVKLVIKSVAEALEYLHSPSVGIIHRDIKPQNIMYKSQQSKSVRLVDFGISSVQDKSSAQSRGLHRAFSVIGSFPYMAPELTRAGYDSKIDIWALGIVMYVMLVGEHPFGAEDPGMTDRVRQGDFKFPNDETNIDPEELMWGPSLIDCCTQMLTVDPAQRISASALLQHPWICSDVQECRVPKSFKFSSLHPSATGLQDEVEALPRRCSTRRKATIARMQTNHIEKRNNWFRNSE